MDIKEKLIKCKHMMAYTREKQVVVPSHDLPFPETIESSLKRAHPIFYFNQDGTFDYKGSTYGAYPREESVHASNIKVPDSYIERLYSRLYASCKWRFDTAISNSNIRDVGNILKEFHQLEFI